MNIYSLLVGAGAVLGLWRVALHAPESQQLARVQAALVTLAGVLVGARLGYILQNPLYYSQHPLEIIAFVRGGLFWPGGFAGALACLAAISAVWRQPLARVLDDIAPLFPPLIATVWLGCWATGLAYGPELPAGTWWALPVQDEQGLWAQRLPLQMLAALTLVVLIVVIEPVIDRLPWSGQSASLTGLLLGLHTILFTLLRADPVPTWRGLGLELWAALALVALSVLSGLWITVPRMVRLVRSAQSRKLQNAG